MEQRNEHEPEIERTLTRDPRRHALLATGALLIYVTTLWFGVTVVGDTVVRSALMAALVVTMAAMAYRVSRAPVPPKR